MFGSVEKRRRLFFFGKEGVLYSNATERYGKIKYYDSGGRSMFC
jgi:hypothetical protein